MPTQAEARDSNLRLPQYGAKDYFAAAKKLRAKAARYRLLAESLFRAELVAEVINCARELEAQAALLEEIAGEALVDETD
jgi:phosphohistidine phosphatase SixA